MGSPAASAPPHVTAGDAFDVGEQIRRLQALAELRAAGILTDGELTDLKRRVLSSGSGAPLGARHAATKPPPHIGGPGSAEPAAAGIGDAPPADTQRKGKAAATGVSPVGPGPNKARDKDSRASGPVLDRREPKGHYVTALKVVGTIPVTCRAGANKRPAYGKWKQALNAAVGKAAAGARPAGSERFSLRIELRLYAPSGQGVRPRQLRQADSGRARRAGRLRVGRAQEKPDEGRRARRSSRRPPPARELRGGGRCPCGGLGARLSSSERGWPSNRRRRCFRPRASCAAVGPPSAPNAPPQPRRRRDSRATRSTGRKPSCAASLRDEALSSSAAHTGCLPCEAMCAASARKHAAA